MFRKKTRATKLIALLMATLMVVLMLPLSGLAEPTAGRDITEFLAEKGLGSSSVKINRNDGVGFVDFESGSAGGSIAKDDKIQFEVLFAVPSLMDIYADILDNLQTAINDADDETEADRLGDLSDALGLMSEDTDAFIAAISDLTSEYIIYLDAAFPLDESGIPFYLQPGDYLTFEAPSRFLKPDGSRDTEIKDASGNVVAYLEYADKTGTNGDVVIVTVRFVDDEDFYDIVDDGIVDFEGSYTSTLTVVQPGGLNEIFNQFNIFDETYYFTVEKAAPEFGLDKSVSSQTTSKGGELTWTVKYTGAIPGNSGAQVSVDGHEFTDDLSNIGDYVADSLTVVDAGGEDVEIAVFEFNSATRKLSFTIDDEEAVAPLTITYKTTTAEDAIIANMEASTGGNVVSTLKNSAEMYNPEEDITVGDDASVKVTSRMVAKQGESNDESAGFIHGDEEAGAVRAITWFLTVNHEGYTLDDAVLSDILTLDTNLPNYNFLRAELYAWSAGTDGTDSDGMVDPNLGGSWGSPVMTWHSQKHVDGTTNDAHSSINNTNVFEMPTGVVANGKETREFALGTINSLVTLKITMELEMPTDEKNIDQPQSFKNEAAFRWGGGPGAGATINVGIGFNAMSKSGKRVTRGTTIANTQEIEWTVNARAVRAGIKEMMVFDLLVHGSAMPTGFTANNGRYAFPAGTQLVEYNDGTKRNEALATLLGSVVGGITATMNHMYVPGSFESEKTDNANGNTDHFIHSVYKVIVGGKWVADLIVMTPNPALVQPTNYEFGKTSSSPFVGNSTNNGTNDTSYGLFGATFRSVVVNPDVFVENTRQHNRAFVLSADEFINYADASDAFKATPASKYATKTAWLYGDDKYFDTSGIANLQRDGKFVALNATEQAEAFDYDTKSVLYVLDINPLGLDLTHSQVLTENGNGETEALGNVTIVDTLPAGWELKSGRLGTDVSFKIWDFSENAYVNPDAYGDILESGDGGFYAVTNTTNTADVANIQTITFEFKTLNKHYAIVLDAGMSEAKAEEFFSQFDQKNIVFTNTMNQTNEYISYESTADVKVSGNLLIKELTENKFDGNLKWTVTYDPQDVDMAKVLLENPDADFELVDTMSHYLAPYLIGDDLDLSKITITEHSDIKPDGTYATTTVYTGDGLSEVVSYSYDLASDGNSYYRLFFKLANPTSKYVIVYNTRLIGEPNNGEKIKNNISVNGASVELEEISAEFDYLESRFNAYMSSLSKLTINKVDGNTGEKLQGAKFTLSKQGEDKVFRSGKTNANGVVIFAAIPAGTYTLVETSAPDGYNFAEQVSYTVTFDKDGQVSSVIGGIPSDFNSSTKTLTVKNYNDVNTGMLTVRKTVSGAAPTNRDYEFELVFDYSDVDDAKTPKDGDTFSFFVAGNAPQAIDAVEGGTIVLRGNQEATFMGLPVGTRVTVTELTQGYTTTIAEGTNQPTDGRTIEVVIQSASTVSVTVNNYSRPVPPPPPNPEIPEEDPEIPEEPEAPEPNTPGNSVDLVDEDWIEFDEEGVPQGEWNWDDDEGVWIYDEFPPLGSIKTGEGVAIYVWCAAAIIAAVGVVLVLGKKKREVQ